VYDEGSVASEVTFNFTSAIRYNKSLLVDGTVVNESMFACPDEGWACPGTENASVYVTCGCPYTAWAQCALKQISNQTMQVGFITCWDDQGLKDKKQTNKSLEAAAKNCSDQLGLANWDDIRACNVDYSGERAELLFSAATRFMEKWPEYTAMDGPFHVPHVLIGKSLSDNEDVDIFSNSTDLGRINKKLCSLEVSTGTCGTLLV